MNDAHLSLPPGPWRLEEERSEGEVYLRIVDASGGPVALVSGGGGAEARDRDVLVARVIAAAPALLSALRGLEWAAEEDHPLGGMYPACPWCGGGDPDSGDTPADYAGHASDCALAAALNA